MCANTKQFHTIYDVDTRSSLSCSYNTDFLGPCGYDQVHSKVLSGFSLMATANDDNSVACSCLSGLKSHWNHFWTIVVGPSYYTVEEKRNP